MHRVAVLSRDRLYADALSEALGAFPDFLTWPRAIGSNVHSADGIAPQIALLDGTMDREAVLQELWRLSDLLPEAKLVVFGIEEENETLLSFIEAGASTYVLRQSSPGEVAALLRLLAEGQVSCSSEMLGRVAERLADLVAGQGSPPTSPTEPLTARELEVVGKMACGLRNKEIGRQLSISVQTVKNHVHRVLEKLGVHRRREAVRRAIELGLINEVFSARKD